MGLLKPSTRFLRLLQSRVRSRIARLSSRVRGLFSRIKPPRSGGGGTPPDRRSCPASCCPEQVPDAQEGRYRTTAVGRAGFEPARGFRPPGLQSGAINHSATYPSNRRNRPRAGLRCPIAGNVFLFFAHQTMTVPTGTPCQGSRKDGIVAGFFSRRRCRLVFSAGCGIPLLGLKPAPSSENGFFTRRTGWNRLPARVPSCG